MPSHAVSPEQAATELAFRLKVLRGILSPEAVALLDELVSTSAEHVRKNRGGKGKAHLEFLTIKLKQVFVSSYDDGPLPRSVNRAGTYRAGLDMTPGLRRPGFVHPG